MTLQEIPSGRFAREVSPSSRPNGWFCVRRGLGTLNRSQCWRTTAASPRTRHAFRIRTAWPTPRTSSPRPISAARRYFSFTSCAMRVSAPAASRRSIATRRRSATGSASNTGQGLRHRGRACGHRHTPSTPRLRTQSIRRPASPSGVAPRAGEVRLPVDRRRPAAYPRDLKLGADRSLPPRTAGLWASLKKLGRGEARGV